MARLIRSQKFEQQTVFGNIPVFGYCIDANTYEEAEAMAKALFNVDAKAEVEKARIQAAFANQPPDNDDDYLDIYFDE